MSFENMTPEQMEQARACKSPEELLSLARAQGYELREDQLAAISGGDCDWFCECNNEDSNPNPCLSAYTPPID